jgi:hypothetical protein
MKKTLLILLSVLPLALAGQGKPHWMNASTRQYEYPEATHITGASQAGGRLQGDAIARLKETAQRDLVQHIRVTVESVMQGYTQSTSASGNEQLYEVFSSQVASKAKETLPGLHVFQPYYDPDDNVTYCFAYVEREALTTSCKSQIALNLNAAEGTLRTANDLVTAKQKSQARQKCKEVIPLLAEVAYLQGLLVAVDKHSAESDWQTERSAAVRQKAELLFAETEQGIMLYIDCNEIIDGESVEIIAPNIQALLTKKGCTVSIAEGVSSADYVLTVKAEIEYCKDNARSTVCSAKANVSLRRAQKKGAVYSELLHGDGVDAADNGNAAQLAFEDLAKIIAEKISAYIKNQSLM